MELIHEILIHDPYYKIYMTRREKYTIYVPPEKRIENGFLFKLMCPGYGFNKFHEKVFMSNDGYVLKNSTFNDYCNAKLVKIAFNNVRI